MVNSIPVNETFSLTLKKQKKKGKKSINKKRATGSVSPAGPASWFFLFGNQIVFAVWGFFFFVTLSVDVLLFCFFLFAFFPFLRSKWSTCVNGRQSDGPWPRRPIVTSRRLSWRRDACRDVTAPLPFPGRRQVSRFFFLCHPSSNSPLPFSGFAFLFFFPSFFFQIFGSQLLLTGCNLLRLVPDISS